jgi:tRNA pseudouridine55 synthase
MSRNETALHGALVLDKPSGPTSFTAMRSAQRVLGVRAAGHGGTLDPMASGVLVVLVGEARKLSALVMDHDKVYEAEVTFGIGTDTEDAAGAVTASAPVEPGALTRERVAAVLPRFVGSVMQVPPRYSALKVGGKSNMSRARAGETFEVAARPARCDAIDLLELASPRVSLRVTCGKGYYVRALARDLGEALGLPAHLSALRRTRVGAFAIERACAPSEARPEDLVPIHEMLPDLENLYVGGEDLAALRVGRSIPVPPGFTAPRALAVTEDGEAVALLTPHQPPGGPLRLKVQRGFVHQPND